MTNAIGNFDRHIKLSVSTGVGMRVSKEEMIAAAMRTWPQAVIEEALGDDAARVMPEAIRLVELRARVPRYQKESCSGWRAGTRPRWTMC